jgi:hypothetical protein
VDVNLSIDDDAKHVPKPDAPTILKGSASVDTRDDGVTSAETIAPGSINSVMSEQSKPYVADRVPAIVPSSSKCGCKHPPRITKQSKPITSVDQVMSQVELPPYHGPRSPLDLVAIKIIFGRIFEAFRQVSQVASAGVAAIEVDKPMKRAGHLPIRKALVTR